MSDDLTLRCQKVAEGALPCSCEDQWEHERYASKCPNHRRPAVAAALEKELRAERERVLAVGYKAIADTAPAEVLDDILRVFVQRIRERKGTGK
jgi:hypothetical protein